MAASKWQSVPLFALLILSFALTNCVARQVTGAKDDKDINKSLKAELDGAYSWQYWQWAWGTPSPSWFPWGTSSLYCRPVSCMGGNCNAFYLEFDYDHLGFSYSYNYMKTTEASLRKNNKTPCKDEVKARPEDGRKKGDDQRDSDDDHSSDKNAKIRSDANVIPGTN